MQTGYEIANFFDDVAFNWDDICNCDVEKLKQIAVFAGIRENNRVIDIACGTGIMIEFLLKYNPSNILAVDFSKNMIGIATSKFKDKRLKFLVSDFLNLSEKDYDVAVMYSAYPHFLDKDKLVEKIYDILNIGGRFIIAHSESKETINNMHNNSHKKRNISTKLLSVDEEKILFLKYFNIDIMMDTKDLYILSGTKNI